MKVKEAPQESVRDGSSCQEKGREKGRGVKISL